MAVEPPYGMQQVEVRERTARGTHPGERQPRLNERDVEGAAVVRDHTIEPREVGGEHRKHRVFVGDIGEEVLAHAKCERRIGLALLEALQPLDIKVNVVAQPWPTLVGRGAKAETASDLVAVYVTPVSPDPDVLAAQYASTALGQFWAMHQLNDPQLDKMVADARSQNDQPKRMAQYAAIQQRIVDLQPCIFGMLENRKWAMRNYVKGFEYCPVRLTGEADLYSLYAAKA